MSKILTSNFFNSLPEGNILLLFVNDEEICFAVADKNSFTYSAFDYIKISEGETVYNVLNAALKNSEILSPVNYRKVIFCSGYRKSTIIPIALFDEKYTNEQLQFSTEIGEDDELLNDELPYLQAVNLFAVPKPILELISQHYNNLEVHHSSTSTITYMLANRTEQHRKMISVIVHDFYFEIIVTEGPQLLIYNTFNFFNNEEFLYYILFVCEQLNISTAETVIQFSGKVTSESENYTLASKYFLKAALSERPDSFNYPTEFEAIPGTFHNYLFSQLICVS